MLFDSDTLAFIGVSAIVVITPGPDMVLVTTHALATGRSAARLAAIGVCVGVLVHAAAAAIGLSALLATSSVSFTIVKVAGAVFLIVLGARTIWRARHSADGARPARSIPASHVVSRARFGSSPFWQGFWSNVLNPKVALLFLSLLPQFVDPGDAALTKTLVLSGTFLAMGLVWLLAYVALVSRVAVLLRRDRVRRRIETISGAVLVALGVRVAVQDAS
jgi:threonine/homoserine/homoserine lactone efflux protein